MKPQEQMPENWKELIDEKYRKDKVLYETKKEAMTDQFKCGKNVKVEKQLIMKCRLDQLMNL